MSPRIPDVYIIPPIALNTHPGHYTVTEAIDVIGNLIQIARSLDFI